ncbi:MAG: protein kinase [Sandaracinaceae bacterium]
MSATTPRDPATLQPGDLVAGRYRIVGRIGEGGMGIVYEALHETLGRPIALKVIPLKLAEDQEMVARFFREARAAASIGHPGIVEVFDVGTEEPPTSGQATLRAGSSGKPPLAFIAMERLRGEELADRIDRIGAFPVKEALHIVADVAEAVSAAHERGIVHRDLKPQNVFLAQVGRREVPKVLDFGIAKLAASDGADVPLTRTGQVFGTPMYMPPEQLRGVKDVDGRADVYALGVILYELLTGRPPFEETSYAALVVKITTEEPEPLANVRPDLPVEVLQLVELALAKDPADRPQTALGLAEALRALAGDDELLRRSATSIPERDPASITGPAAFQPPDAFPETVAPGGTTSPGAEAFEDTRLDTGRGTGGDGAGVGSSSSRRWLLPAAAGLALAIIGGGLAVAMSSGADPDEARGTPRAGEASRSPGRDGDGARGQAPGQMPESERASGAALPAGAGDPDEPRGAPAGAEPQAGAPAPARVAVGFPAPRGATIRVGDQSCTAPCSLELDPEATHRVEASMPGRRGQTRELAPPFPAELPFRLVRRGGRRTDPGTATPNLLPR